MAGRIVRHASVPRRDVGDGWATELDYLAPGPGLERVSLRVYRLAAGRPPGPFHFHARSESLYFVLGGTISVRVADERSTLGVGDLAFIPPGEPHAVANAGDVEAVILELYAPAAADFVRVDEPGAS